MEKISFFGETILCVLNVWLESVSPSPLPCDLFEIVTLGLILTFNFSFVHVARLPFHHSLDSRSPILYCPEILAQFWCRMGVWVWMWLVGEEGRAGGMNPPRACNLFWKTEEARRGL